MRCDIDIMLTGDPSSPEEILKSKIYEAIVDHLTGIGRMVVYSTNRQIVVALIEGQFTKGKLDGFGRIITPFTMEEKNFGFGCSVQVGFWKPVELGGS